MMTRYFDRRMAGWLVALCLLLAPLAALAQNVVGTVQFVHGGVMALNPAGEDRILSRGDEIREGEVLVTGPDGAMQLQLSDGGLVALRANTEMSIDEYQYEQAEDDRSLFSVARGVFRKISGAIGRDEPASVRMQTPVATIGIRGTDFEGGFLPEDNDDPAGAYLRVNSGRAWLGNEAGELDLRPGQAGFVASSYDMPQLLEQAPGLFRVAMPTGPAEGDTGDDDGPPTDSENLRQTTHERSDDLAWKNDLAPEALGNIYRQQWESFLGGVNLERLTGGGAVAVNNARAWSIVDEGASGSQLWYLPDEGLQGLSSLIFQGSNGVAEWLFYDELVPLIDGGQVFPLGGDESFEVVWGRWEDGLYFFEDSVVGDDPRMAIGELHYMMTDFNTPLQVVLAQTGVADFEFMGGTVGLTIDDDLIEAGQLFASGQVAINFDTGAMDYDLMFGMFDGLYNIELESLGGASVGEFLTQGIALAGLCEGFGACDGGAVLEGVAGGSFAGPEAEALLSYFSAFGFGSEDEFLELVGTALFGEFQD